MASEDKATEGQIKRLYAVLHSVGLDPTQWKKDQNIASYAKLTRAQCSAFIDEVEALEAEQKGRLNQPGPTSTTTPTDRVAAEAQKIRDEQGRAPAPALHPEVEYVDLCEQVTEAELIKKYLELLAQVTVAVEQEGRIPDREKGYAVNLIYHTLTDGKGGDHEGRA